MMQLKDILQGISYQLHTALPSIEIEGLTFDSREAKNGMLFFAIRGSQVDGHAYCAQAAEAGCEVIICEKENPELKCLQLVVENSAAALGQIAANFYGNPSAKLQLIGITGTNGKTTTTTLLFDLFRKLGYSVGLLSTVVNRIDDQEIKASHTTPNPIELNSLLAQMVELGCSHCFMEVSSHAIVQHRITGLDFCGGVFTNITHDHLDYHGTFKDYIAAKKTFFDHLPKSAFALTNVDDKNGMVMLQNTKASKHTYALKSPADFRAKVLENEFSGLVMVINNQELWTRLIGDFNAYNLLAVYAVSRLLEEDELEVLTHLSELQSVAGRFEFIQTKSGITGIVDYAHTPDALENVLKTIANIRTKNETVYTVIGCGGDRDKTKRPKMAAIACELSDRVMITSDNPRSEDPAVIIAEMLAGVSAEHFKKTLAIQDRAQAIKTACSMAVPGDIVLVAGKGHEKYQEIKGVKHDFDDLQLVKELFQKLEK